MPEWEISWSNSRRGVPALELTQPTRYGETSNDVPSLKAQVRALQQCIEGQDDQIQEMLDQLHSFHTAMLTVVQEVGMIEAKWLNETYEHHHKECEMLAVGCSQKPPQVSNVFL